MPNQYPSPPQLPAPPNAPLAAYPAPPPGWYGPDSEPEEPTVPLSHYLWILKRHRWSILSFVAACVLATLIVSERVTPIYESTAAIDVDRRMPAGVLGQDSNQYPTMDADQFLATQVKLIQSDSVLRPVADKFHLRKDDLAASSPSEPRPQGVAAFFSFLTRSAPSLPSAQSRASAQSRDREGAVAAPSANDSLPTTRAQNAPVTPSAQSRDREGAVAAPSANDSLPTTRAQNAPVTPSAQSRDREGAVDNPLPTTRAQNAPVTLKQLKVTRPPNTYLLLISYRSPNPDLAADVANAIANSYILHTYNIRFRSSAGLAQFMEKQLEELKAKMESSAEALAKFERELNVINPEEKTSILSARLLQLNTDYTTAQTERVRKQAAYNSIRAGELEAAQVSTQGESLKRLTEKLEDADQHFGDVKAHYGVNHPEYRKAAAQVAQIQAQLTAIRASIVRRVEIEYREAQNREAMLQKAVTQTKAEFDALNARSFEYQNLKQEAEADKKLYEELTTKIKEAGINAGFQNSAIRLADPARPADKPVFPNLPLNLALAFLFSGLLAVGAAVLSDVLDNTIRDPEQAQRLLNTEVVGSLPLVKDWKKKLLPAARKKSGSTSLVKVDSPVPALLSADSRESRSFEEAVRTLRNSILLGSFDRPLKSILVTSATPGEGKTTTAIHLAIAHAQQKHKTLLIDADLRRPGVSRTLGLNGDAGLGTILSNGMLWREKLAQLPDLPDLDILAAGPVSRRTVDLLGPRLPRILDEAAADYDLVIVDAPPLLGFPEPLQMATIVDGVVVVSLAGQTNRKAIGSVMATLQRLRANVVGLVLNEVTHESSDSYYYYGYYGKKYKYYKHYDKEQKG